MYKDNPGARMKKMKKLILDVAWIIREACRGSIIRNKHESKSSSRQTASLQPQGRPAVAVPSKGEGVEDLHDEGDEVVAATKVHLRCCVSCDACTRHPHRSEVAAVRCIVRESMRNDDLREKVLRTLPSSLDSRTCGRVHAPPSPG